MTSETVEMLCYEIHRTVLNFVMLKVFLGYKALYRPVSVTSI